MEELKEKQPSLPTNYVSLVQLQERWKKEQLRKKQEEEERKQRENQEEQLKREKGVGNGEGNRRKFYNNRKTVESKSKNVEEKHGEIGEGKTPSGSVTNNRRRFRRNQKSVESKSVNVGEKLKDNENRREIVNESRKIESTSNLGADESHNEKVRVQKVEAAYDRSSEESQNEKVRVQKVEAELNSTLMESHSEKVRVQDEQQSGILKKEKKRRKKRNRKPRRDENLTGGKELDDKYRVAMIKGNEEEKKIPVATVRSDYLPINQIPVGIGRKFANLSINGVKEGNVRHQRKYWGDFGSRKVEKGRGSGLIWVKKGDTVACGATI